MQSSSKLETKVTFKGFDSSDALRAYAEKRAAKFEKHLHSMIHCDFVFSIEKTKHIAQVHITAGDFEAKAEAKSETMYAAIDEVTDKLLNQSRKYKEKHTSHAGKSHHAELNAALVEETDEEPTDDDVN